VPLRPVVEAMYWNPRRSDDPAHRWFRSTIAEIAATELDHPVDSSLTVSSIQSQM
jgi:hypothetical protein